MKITQLKYFIKKIIGKNDPRFQFEKFERELLNKQTIANFAPLCQWAKDCSERKDFFESEANYLNSDDDIIKQWLTMSSAIMTSFKNKYSDSQLRILIHIPDKNYSPAGFSLFTNLLQALDYLGVKALAYNDNYDFSELIKKFQPNILLTSDNDFFLKAIDWRCFADYKKSSGCKLALTASLEEYGNTPLVDRLIWAKDHQVDFYYSFRSTEYIEQKKEYQDFANNGYKILNLEFGANILLYYPIPNIARDLDYIFLGSGNYSRYLEYFSEVMQSHSGFAAGVGWSYFNWVPQEHQRYLYSRAKVGLNISGSEHIKLASELTERTYILAAMGVPQLIDNPKLLFNRFEPDMLFVADNPTQYTELFEYILQHEEEAKQRALKAQARVLSQYTNLHRANDFIQQIYEHVIR